MNKRKLTGVSVCILIGLLVITFLYWNRELRFQSLFEDNYIFESVSDAVQNRNGYTYVIDQGKKAVIVLDSERKLVRKLIGGNENADFFYAARVCGDDSGNIYIADLISGAQGNQIQKDRIIKITDHKREILYEFDYAQCENPPLQYGDILELQEYDGNIYFVKAEEDSIDVYRIMEKNGENLVEKILEIPCTLFVSDAAYDVANEILIITTRLGEVYYYSSDMAEWTPVARISKEQIPWSITSAAGEVYYTDLQSRGIFRFSLYAPELPECVYQSESVLYSICVSEDGSTVTATDNEQYIYLETADNSATECGDAGIGNRFLVFLFWVLLVVAVLTVTVMIIVIILRIIKNIQDKSGFSRMALVVISSVIVAAIASYSSISSLMANHDRLVMDNMQVFAESLRQQIDSEKLKQLGEISDYHSDAYMNIKDKLDSMISASYEHEVYYYYVIYSTDGKSINCLMDYEDTTVCGQPIYEYGDNEYTQVLENGEAYTVSEISSYGSWMFTLLPIRDHSGTIIAELEVGSSLDDAVKEKKELVIENIVTVICSCGVMIMLVLECIFALSFFEKRKGISREKWDITQQMPIRVMVFLVYVTDSMQDAFIAILCSRLYSDTLPISKELAIALPMSLQLLAAALFSAFGGRLAGKYGIRKLMRLGLASQMAGFLMCILIPGYEGILIGKLFIGIGLGTVYVTANTIASMGGKEEYVETGFADVSAGVLSGVTIGAGLGSIILSFADYRIVYLVGAVLLGCGLLLTIQAKNVKLEKDKNSEAVKSRFHIFKFLINRRVAAFFGFILIPFMISLSYREYFFPLYVEQFGIDEVQIGRIYLGCGMLVIYIGPCFLNIF